MPSDVWLVRIADMLLSAEKIGRYAHGMDHDALIANEVVVDAVLWNIHVIGEAARHIPDDVKARFPDVPWGPIRGMRNVVVHDYSGIDLHIVWSVVKNRVPPLIARLREILEAERGAGG